MAKTISIPRDGTVLATTATYGDSNECVQAKFVEVHEAHHEIRLFGHNGQNEFATHIEVACDESGRFYERNCYIQTGSIEDMKLHLKLLEYALRNLNTPV